MPIAVGKTGDDDIDGILWGWRWDVSDFTFSFPRSTANYDGYAAIVGFQGFGTAQQAATRKILNHIESFCDVSFTEVGPNQGVANFRFAEARQINYTNDPGLTRFPGLHDIGSAEANPPEDYYFGNPPTAPIFSQGDSWYNRTDYNDVRLGSFAFSAGLMHETGHNLGLKHGHVVQQGHGLTFPKLPRDHNSYEYSVMTYAQFVGDNPGNGDNAPDHPTTYMQDDIAALQYLYGANFRYESDNTRYKWNPKTGESYVDGVSKGRPVHNYILQTVWDGGGVDTYDFSNYTSGVRVNLTPGAWSRTTTEQLANLGSEGNGPDHFARGSIANALLYRGDTRSLIENVVGSRGDDSITGNGADNLLVGGNGDDRMKGLRGDDTYVVSNLGDRVSERPGQGEDTVRSSLSFLLDPNFEDLVLTGSARIFGVGNGLDNSLTGNGNANGLNGGAGHDVLKGLGGADAFIFTARLKAANADRIVDFQGNDRIWLDDAVFRALDTGNLPGGAFKVVASADARVGRGDHILYDRGDGELYYDANGGGASGRVKFAELDTHVRLTAGDFLVV